MRRVILSSLLLGTVAGSLVLPRVAYAGKEEMREFAPVGAGVLVAQEDRRRPGAPPQVEDLPKIDPNAVAPPKPTLPRESIPIPDRWRLIEALGVHDRWWDPYNQNTLKGDRPVFDDWFVNLSVISDTIYEPRSVPTPTSPNTSPKQDAFGKVTQNFFSTTLIPSLSIIQGDTTFRPPNYEFRLTPVLNYNRATASEDRALLINPQQGRTRTDTFIGIQEAFLDYHLRNVSSRYDFDSLRIGIQPVQADFRGFLFQDQQLGVRLFGNRANNVYQYNLAWFRRIEKDTNSGLNDIGQSLRKDDVVMANLYVQDFPTLGFTTQGTVVYNRNREDNEVYFNNNGFQERPAPFGSQRPHAYDVTYIGVNGDGHFGRLNLTTSAYYAVGRDHANPFGPTGVGKEPADIRAFMLAAEPSMDFDWIRVRGSLMYASGDKNTSDNKETGFDAIFENPQFAGADTSYWIRQAVPLIGGGGLQLSGRNGLLGSLRTSKDQGQSNFNNPGLVLIGGGADVDVLPELRLTTNLNHLSFASRAVIEQLRGQLLHSNDIGWDLSIAATYRPFMTQNVVFRLSAATLFGGDAFKELFQTQDHRFYSVLANLILTY